MGKNLVRQLDPYADVHPIGIGGNFKVFADILHPFASASSAGNDALLSLKCFLVGVKTVAGICFLHLFHGSEKMKIHLVLQSVVKVLQDHIVDVGAQMPDGGIQKVQVVLHAKSFDFTVGGRIELGAQASHVQVDFIHIAHEGKGFVLSDILIKGAAEIVGNVVFPVRKCAGTAEAVHDGTGRTTDAVFDFFAVDRAFSTRKRSSCFQNRHLQRRIQLHQFISRENTAGTGADDHHIVKHSFAFRFFGIYPWYNFLI